MKKVTVVNMKIITLLLAFTASSVGAVDWTNIWARWSSNLADRVNSFFDLPITVDAAVEAGYVEVPSVNKFSLTTYCLEGDHRVCLIYQNNGCVAGFQLAELVSDLSNVTLYDMSSVPTFLRGIMFGKDVWLSIIYTRDPELLSSGGCGCDNGFVGEEGLWFETKTGYLTAPRKQADLQSEWQAGICVTGQGYHFFYNITETSSCQDWIPHFVVYDEGELVSAGFITFGVPTVLNRDWYEPYNASLTKILIPTGPSCLEDWVAYYDSILIHVFFNAAPWNTVCST